MNPLQGIVRRGLRRLGARLPGHEKRRSRRRRRRIVTFLLLLGVASAVVMLPALLGAPSDDDGVAQQQVALASSLSVSGVPHADAFNETLGLGIDPRLVAAVAAVSSDFDPTRGCAAGEVRQGIMQLPTDVAAAYAVDPCSPEAAIGAGAAHLRALFDETGDWADAVEAYGGEPAPIVPVGVADGESFRAAVLARWEMYQQQVPAGFAGAAGRPPVFTGPVTVLGSTERYAEPGITAKTQRMLDVMVPLFGRSHQLHCFRYGDKGEHPLGRACDFVMSVELNTMPTAAEIAHGWAFADYLVANAGILDIYYVIWQGRIWASNRADEGWRTYYAWPEACTPGPPPNCNLQQNHYDHVHVSVLP